MRELPRVGHRGVHSRLDPDYAPTVEVFDNLTHEQIHSGVAQLNPGALQSGSQAWQNAAGGLNDAVVQAHTEISGAIADGWRGDAAGLAAAAVRDFEAAGRHLADVLTTVGQRLSQAGDAAETLRGAIPEPSGAEPDLAAALLDPHAATGNVAAQRAADDERADAVRVMESVYTGAFVPTGSEVPAFPDLPDQISGAPQAPGAVSGPAASEPGAESPGRPSYSTPGTTPVSKESDPTAGAGQPLAATGNEEPSVVTASTGSVAAPAAVVAAEPQATNPAQTVPTPNGSAAPTAAPVAPPGPGTPVAPATVAGVPVAGAPIRPAASGKDEERRREEPQRSSGGEAVAGMGAGAIGGMMGGAMAADHVRSGPPVVPPRPDRAEEPDDEDLHFDDEDLTFLEPAESGGQLIGSLDPTTPAVLGEWTEAE